MSYYVKAILNSPETTWRGARVNSWSLGRAKEMYRGSSLFAKTYQLIKLFDFMPLKDELKSYLYSVGFGYDSPKQLGVFGNLDYLIDEYKKSRRIESYHNLGERAFDILFDNGFLSVGFQNRWSRRIPISDVRQVIEGGGVGTRIGEFGLDVVLSLIERRRNRDSSLYHEMIREYTQSIGIYPKAFDRLEEMLNHPDLETQRLAAEIMGLTGSPRFYNPLKQKMSSSYDYSVARASAFAFAKLQMPDVPKTLIDSFIKSRSMVDEERKRRLRDFIFKALSHAGNNVTIKRNLEEIFKNYQSELYTNYGGAVGLLADRNLIYYGAKMLWEAGDQNSHQILIQHLETHSDYRFRAAIAEAIASVGDEKALSVLTQSLSDDEIKGQILEYIKHIPCPISHEILQSCAIHSEMTQGYCIDSSSANAIDELIFV
ncbi:MAG: HEAT repeat domain-containing protein [Pseudomonadota bacterium]